MSKTDKGKGKNVGLIIIAEEEKENCTEDMLTPQYQKKL